MKTFGQVLAIAVKLAISVALIWYAFRQIDLSNASRLLRSLHPGIIVLALAALAFQQFLGALRLHRLLQLIQMPVRAVTAVDAVFVGLFFGTTFVSFISGDAMRVWRLVRAHVPVAGAFQAILFDRIFGFVTLIAMIGMGLPLLVRLTADRAMLLSVLIAVLLGIVGTLLFLLMNRAPRALLRWRVVRLAAQTSSVALAMVMRPTDVLSLLGLSFVVQSLNVIGVYVIAVGLGVSASLIDLMVLVPPVVLLTMLPVSFAGWGVRESAMVVVLGLLGVGAEQSVAVSVCFGLCMMVVGLPGGLIWLAARREVDMAH
jgi:glycosyltransferase 2 family protein